MNEPIVRNLFFIKIFMQSGLAIDLVCDYSAAQMEDEIQQARRANSRFITFAGFDSENDLSPNAKVKVRVDDVIAIIQRDLASVKTEMNMRRLQGGMPPVGPTLVR